MICVECGAEFHCGMQDATPCWCSSDFAAVLPVPGTGAACLCTACLQRRIDQHTAHSRAGRPGPPETPPAT